MLGVALASVWRPQGYPVLVMKAVLGGALALVRRPQGYPVLIVLALLIVINSFELIQFYEQLSNGCDLHSVLLDCFVIGNPSSVVRVESS